MHQLIRDLRQAIRGFRKSPGTTAIIIAALALGIGVNVSSFIFVEGVVLNVPVSPTGSSDDGVGIAGWNGGNARRYCARQLS
jgi:hypothetical protein